MEHPLVDFANRRHLICFMYRSALQSECPVDLVEIIVLYSQWMKCWKPEWPSVDDYAYLDGRIRAIDGEVASEVTRYNWKNFGGRVVSLNALPTLVGDDEYEYGKYVEWTVNFHRMAHCSQWFGITATPWQNGQRWGQRWGVDSNGRFVNPLSTEHWYIPQRLEQTMDYQWKTAKAKIETYTFKWDIDEETLTIFDPNMQKMGKIGDDYTYAPKRINGYCGKLHILAECNSARSKLTYKFNEM